MTRAASRRLSAVLLTLLTCLGLLLSGTSVAAAAQKDHSCHHHGHSDHGKKPKGKGKFEPAPSGVFTDPFTACGLEVSVSNGDKDAVVSRITTQKDGSVFEEYKGPFTVDVTAPGKRKINELDNSGSYTILTKADGSSSILTVRAPALIYPFDDSEPAVFAAAGLPEAFYFTSGKLVAKLDAEYNIAKIIEKPRHYKGICEMLKPIGS